MLRNLIIVVVSLLRFVEYDKKKQIMPFFLNITIMCLTLPLLKGINIPNVNAASSGQPSVPQMVRGICIMRSPMYSAIKLTPIVSKPKKTADNRKNNKSKKQQEQVKTHLNGEQTNGWSMKSMTG